MSFKKITPKLRKKIEKEIADILVDFPSLDNVDASDTGNKKMVGIVKGVCKHFNVSYEKLTS